MTTANDPGTATGNSAGQETPTNSGTPPEPATGQKTAEPTSSYSQADIDAAAAAARRKAESELEKARAELEKFRKAQMTEQERAIEAAKEEVSKAKDAEFTRFRVESEVRLKLTQMGLDPDLSHTVLALQGIDDPAEAAKVTEGIVKTKGWKPTSASAPGQSGQPTTRSPGGNQPLSVSDIMASFKAGNFEKDRASILAAMRDGKVQR